MLKNSLKDELLLAFELGLNHLMSGKKRKSSLQTLFTRNSSSVRRRASSSDSYNDIIPNEELKKIHIDIGWRNPTRADVIIRFMEEKCFNEKWCKKAMEEFYRTQVMTKYNLI